VGTKLGDKESNKEGGLELSWKMDRRLSRRIGGAYSEHEYGRGETSGWVGLTSEIIGGSGRGAQMLMVSTVVS
jgi:hypothetical protein